MKKSETPAVAAHILDMLLLQSKKSWKNAGATLLYIYTYIYCCIRTPETKSHQNRTKTHAPKPTRILIQIGRPKWRRDPSKAQIMSE